MTDSERKLWRHLRGKQVLDVRFYRQRPIGDYIVDFYSPSTRLVVEVDGSQHFDESGISRDAERDAFLRTQGVEVMRFSNLEVLKNVEGVVAPIQSKVEGRIKP